MWTIWSALIILGLQQSRRWFYEMTKTRKIENFFLFGVFSTNLLYWFLIQRISQRKQSSVVNFLNDYKQKTWSLRFSMSQSDKKIKWFAGKNRDYTLLWPSQANVWTMLNMNICMYVEMLQKVKFFLRVIFLQSDKRCA